MTHIISRSKATWIFVPQMTARQEECGVEGYVIVDSLSLSFVIYIYNGQVIVIIPHIQ